MKKQIILVGMLLFPVVMMAAGVRDDERITAIASLVSIVVGILFLIFFFRLCIDVRAMRRFFEFQFKSTVRDAMIIALDEERKMVKREQEECNEESDIDNKPRNVRKPQSSTRTKIKSSTSKESDLDPFLMSFYDDCRSLFNSCKTEVEFMEKVDDIIEKYSKTKGVDYGYLKDDLWTQLKQL